MDNKYLAKRYIAFILDLLLISAVITIFSYFFVDKVNIEVLNSEMNSIHSLFLSHDITLGTYLNRYAEISYNIDYENILVMIIRIAIVIGYYIILVKQLGGQTLAMRIMNLKIETEDGKNPEYKQFVIRSLLINSLFVNIFQILCLIITRSTVYLVFVLIGGIFQFLLVIISVYMILYRRDRRGIHDLFSNTSVVVNDRKETVIK